VAIGLALLLAKLLVPAMLQAQEVRYVDLTGVLQRTELRRPPLPQPECKAGVACGSGGSVGVSIADGGSDSRDPRKLTVQILSVVPERIDPLQPIEVEFSVLNSGRVPIELPVWPHLSDLQPPDESQSFSYMSLALAVNVIAGDAQQPIAGARSFVELYGSAVDARTMLVLGPGEWIRVRASVKFPSPREAFPAWLKGTFWMHANTSYPRPGGSFKDVRNIYPNEGTAPPLPVQILPAK